MRRKLVRVSGDYAQLVPHAREVKEAKRLEQVSSALAAVLSAPNGVNTGRVFKIMSFDLNHPAPGAVGRILLQRRIAKIFKGFMADLEAACNVIAVEVPDKKTKQRRSGKTSVVLLNQD